MKSPGETSAGKTKVIYMCLMFHTFKDVRSVLCAVCVGGIIISLLFSLSARLEKDNG